MPRNRPGRNGGHGFSLDGGTGRPAAKPPRNRLPRGRGAASHGRGTELHAGGRAGVRPAPSPESLGQSRSAPLLWELRARKP